MDKRVIQFGLAASLLWILASQVNAAAISSWGVPQFTGRCGHDAGDAYPATGLACVNSAEQNLARGVKIPADVVEHPDGYDVTIGKVDTEESVRAAIYDATGVDPGLITEITKVDDDSTTDGNGSAPNNGLNGLWVYDQDLNTTGVMGQASLGYWRYTGPEIVEYLVVKAGIDFGIWHIDTLPTVMVMIDGVETEVYKWDFTSAAYADGWTGVWDPVDNTYQQNMSHITIYRSENGTPPGGQGQVPTPAPLLLMLGGLAAIRLTRRA